MSQAGKWSVVVPTCRPQQFIDFLGHWDRFFRKHDVHLIVVCDTPSVDPEISAAVKNKGYTVTVFDWANIPENIPTKTDMIRSAGIWYAWKLGTTYTLTLDDDVRPLSEDIFDAYEDVFTAGAVVSDFFDVGSLTSFGKPLRGFPFRDRHRQDVVVQFGGWHGVLDYDAPTQLAGVPSGATFSDTVIPVPRGVAVTGCIMNAAWQTKYAHMMWQLPLLNGKYNRFGDIWAGLFCKRVCDWLGKAVVINGKASVLHERASDPITNLERESPGIPVNERLWSSIHEGSYWAVTEAAYRYFLGFDMEYAEHFKTARDYWQTLFY